MLTVRNLPVELERRVHERADEMGASVTKAVVRLLEERLGLASGRQPEVLHDDLDHLAGCWTTREAGSFDEALATQRAIDPDLWA